MYFGICLRLFLFFCFLIAFAAMPHPACILFAGFCLCILPCLCACFFAGFFVFFLCLFFVLAFVLVGVISCLGRVCASWFLFGADMCESVIVWSVRVRVGVCLGRACASRFLFGGVRARVFFVWQSVKTYTQQTSFTGSTRRQDCRLANRLGSGLHRVEQG